MGEAFRPGFVKYRELAVNIISTYIEEGIKNTKGTAISISVKRLKKWYSKRAYGGELPGRLKYAMADVLRALYDQGLISRAGGNYLVHKDSELWLAAERGKVRQLIKLALSIA